MITRVKELRVERGLKQEALADFVGSSQQTISRIENEIGTPPLDLLFASSVESMLLKISKFKKLKMEIEVYADGDEIIKNYSEEKQFDIIYLDIEMKNTDGIETAKEIRKRDRDVIIIYISGYDTYFIQLFEVEPFRFIKKPINETTFQEYFDKAYERIIDKADSFYNYKYNKKEYRLPLKEIYYFESSKRIIYIHHTGGTDKFYGKLNQIEEYLSDGTFTFIRIHQSFLVNYRYIKTVKYDQVCLLNNNTLQISEDRKKSVRQKYSDLLGGEFFD